MLVQGKIRESDFIFSVFLQLRPNMVVFFHFLIFPLFLMKIFGAIDSEAFLLYLASASLFVFIFFFYRAKRQFRSEPTAAMTRTMEFRQDGVFMKGEKGEQFIPWSRFVKWKKTKRLVLLYPAGIMLYLIPSHFFGSQEAFQAFVTLVASKLGNASW